MGLATQRAGFDWQALETNPCTPREVQEKFVIWMSYHWESVGGIESQNQEQNFFLVMMIKIWGKLGLIEILGYPKGLTPIRVDGLLHVVKNLTLLKFL